MKNEQEKIIHFNLTLLKGVSVTHGYNITNAFPFHFHSTYNLGIIELGEREIFYRGTKTILKQNDIFIIQSFEPHCCKSVDNSSHSYKILTLNLNNSCYFPQLIIQNPTLLNTIKEFHAIAEYEKTSSKLTSLYEGIIEQLLMCSSEHNSNVQDETDLTKINLAKRFVEKNCHLNVTLKKMAEVACLSEFHFNRYFHKYFGLSPYAYYLVCKMKKAQNVLIKQKSVTATTYDIGFFDQSHFTKLFKKHIGVTPGKYLRDNKYYENK